MFIKTAITSISIMGYVIFLKYWITPQGAVNWILDPMRYSDPQEDQIPGPGIELLESLLRKHYVNNINEYLQKQA